MRTSDDRAAAPPPEPRGPAAIPWGWVIAVVSGVFLGLTVFTFNYGEGLSYFSRDPAACVNCHIMQPQFDSWQKASHHTVAGCVDCHLPQDFIPKWIAKAENGYLHSRGFTFQDFPEPIFIRERNMKILNSNCLNCHSGLVHDLVAGTDPDSDAFRCVHCHRSAGHGETVGLGKYQAVNRELMPTNRMNNETQ